VSIINLHALPLTIRCRCGQALLRATVSVSIDGRLESHDLLVDYIHMMCPGCRKHVCTAEDDFSRALSAIQDEL
jgi:hypothetical protein